MDSPVFGQDLDLDLPRERLGQSSRLTSLVISEIMYHPPARPDAKRLEFIEIFNALDTPEDISGYRLAGDVAYAFPAGTVLPGRSFLVMARNPADVQDVYGLSGVLGPFDDGRGLPNKAGVVELRNRLGAIVLSVLYTSQAPWPVQADGAGHSLVLARPSFGERSPAAWAPSALLGGSPGRPDPASTEDEPGGNVVINEFLAHTATPDRDFIELYNHGPAPADISGCVLTDDPDVDRFILPQGTVIPAGAFRAFDELALGFALDSAGEMILFKNAARTRVLDALKFEGQEMGVATGRSPDGSRLVSRLQRPTPGAANAAVRVSDIVLNEILFHPVTGDDDDQFVELYNQSSAPVDLEGWQLRDGVAFTFPSGAVIPANGYVVVGRNPARLRASLPNLPADILFGGFSGRLAGRGERLALTMPGAAVSANASGVLETNQFAIVVDEVTYADGGRWGQWADGGGSSLERIDARADGRWPANWADSDESSKAPWTAVSVTGRLDNGNVSADQLQVLLQGAGECLIDNVEVVDGSGVNVVPNSTFEANAAGWIAEGTKSESGWEPAEGFNSAHSYHVRAVERGDNQINRIRTRLSSTLPSGSSVTIRAQVRWVKGHPEILFRLRGNWLEAVGVMDLPRQLGTPGTANSRSAPNGPPAIFDVQHAPVLPAAGEALVLTARVSDPDGIASLQVQYRVDPATEYSTMPMNDAGVGGDAVAGDGVYSVTLPGQPAGTLMACFLQAVDASNASLIAAFPEAAPTDEALVRFGESPVEGTFPVYRIWMTQATFSRWTSRSKLDNTPLPITFVLDDSRVIQGARGLFAGSPYIAPGYNTPSGRRCGYSLSFPSDDRFLGDTDLVLDWPGGHGGETTALQEQMAYWMAERMDLPYSHRYYIRLHVNGVSDMQRGTVFEAVNQPAGEFIAAWVPDDPDGDFYKIDRAFEFSDSGSLIADPQPRLQNYTTVSGAKKTERYRWTWLKRAGSPPNDYRNVFHLVDALNASSPEPYTSQSEALIAIEEWMGTLALEHILVNFDAYGHEIGKNMYAYKPQKSGWQLYMFDLDWLMLAAAGRGSSYAPSVAPLFNAEDPTMVRMYTHPPFRRAYFRAVRKAVDGPLVPANSNPVMDAKYQSLRANGITMCDGQALTGPSVVKTWFSQRRAFLVRQLETVAAEFAITSHGGLDFTTNSPVITLTGTAPIDVKGLRVNGLDYPVAWTSVTTWEMMLALQPGANALVLEAHDAAGKLLNLTDRIGITADFVTESPVDRVVFNEIMAHPAVPGAEFIELHNGSPGTWMDLSGWRIEGADFTFPAGTFIAPGAERVITADRAAFMTAYGNTTPFAGEFSGRLDPLGGTLTLRAPGGVGVPVTIDTVRYEGAAPWPMAGPGVSLQLIDPAQDNFRVANWGAAGSQTGPEEPLQWKFVSVTGTASSSRLYVYLGSAGEVSLDDLTLVPGEQAGVGLNLIPNGDFESGFPEPWNVSGILAGSRASNDVRHSGNASCRVVSTSPGSSRDTSIWQDIGPLTQGAPYTLSYWYLPSTHGPSLTVRLSGNGIVSSHETAPDALKELFCTPGAPNSVRASLPSISPVWINEFSPGGAAGAGGSEPWVELYNAGSETLSLDGWHLTDNYSNLTQWAFPAGTILGPKSFLLVWLDGAVGQSTASSPHTSFRAAPGAGSLALVWPFAERPTVLDYVHYSGMNSANSIGFYPDGNAGGRQVFLLPTPGSANNGSSPSRPLYINEWLAANSATLTDPADGQFDDWFELFNPSDIPVDLSGYRVSETLAETGQRWRIPNGTTIPPRGFLLVWADEDAEQNVPGALGLHADFRLSKDGETIALFAPDGQLADSVTFGPQTDDVAEGRSPDGGPGIAFLAVPTPGGPNALPAGGAEEIALFVPSLTATGELILTWSTQPGRVYRVQAKEDLRAPSWTDLMQVTAVGLTESHAVPLTGLPQSFYRIVRAQ